MSLDWGVPGRFPSGERPKPLLSHRAWPDSAPWRADSGTVEEETHRLCNLVRGEAEAEGESRSSAFTRLVNVLREAKGALRAGEGGRWRERRRRSARCRCARTHAPRDRVAQVHARSRFRGYV